MILRARSALPAAVLAAGLLGAAVFAGTPKSYTISGATLSADKKWEPREVMERQIAGVTFEEYRGQAATADGTIHRFIAAGEAHAFPEGTIDTFATYFAPADYHLLVEADKRLSLSSEEPVNYSRPAIDLLLSSAAEAYGAALIGGHVVASVVRNLASTAIVFGVAHANDAHIDRNHRLAYRVEHAPGDYAAFDQIERHVVAQVIGS